MNTPDSEWNSPRTKLFMLMFRLDIIGMRRVAQSMMHAFTGQGMQAPPCSIPLAIVSLQREYIQFVPRRLEDKEFLTYKRNP